MRLRMDTGMEVRQAGRTRERDRFRDCRAVSARVHAMEAAGQGVDGFSLEEDEDLAIEAARAIVSGDAAKLRQLGVDLEFPGTGGTGTGDVAPACCAQLTRPRALGKFLSWTILESVSVLIGIGARILSCSIRYVFSPAVSLQEI